MGNSRKAETVSFNSATRRVACQLDALPIPASRGLTGCFSAASKRCQLFVNVLSIVRKDQFTGVAAGARGGMLHEFRENLTENLFELLLRGADRCC